MKFLLIAILLTIPFSAKAQISSDRYASWNNVVGHKKVIKKKQKIVKIKRQRYHSPTLARRSFIADTAAIVGEPIRQVAAIVGGRPEGCPRRFCGCALAIKLFGRIVPHLNLAANWLKFPRVTPAPGMVAARRGHVFKLIAHVKGNIWSVWDANSGGGHIRIHHRSIAGYVVVNPLTKI